MNLKYLFECHFSDGTFLTQTQDDVSSTNPEKSAFFDVLQRIDDVVSFGLYNDDHTYAVDLVDGHFEIDGVPFTIQDPSTPLLPDAKFRLIYFRRVQRHFNIDSEEQDVEIEFHLGWQTNLPDGKNTQQTIGIS